MIAFSVLLQWASGEKSRRKVAIYKYSNSCTVIGNFALDNKYRILTLNFGSLFIVFAKVSEVIMVHGDIYIFIYKKGTDKLTLLLILRDEISTLRILSFGRCYNGFIYLMTVHKYITQKLSYTKKKHYRCIDMYVCMHRMGVPLRITTVPMLGLGLVGAAPISFSVYVLGGSVYTCIQKRMYSKIVCNCFCDSLFLYNFGVKFVRLLLFSIVFLLLRSSLTMSYMVLLTS